MLLLLAVLLATNAPTDAREPTTRVVTTLSPAVLALITFASATAAVALPLWIPMLMASRRKTKDNEEAQKAKDNEWAREDAVAKRVEETASRLVASNERVAATSGLMNVKLDVIHDLVNNEKTMAMHAQLDETQRGLVSLKEIMSLKEASGKKPSAEAIGAIKATEERIAKLQASILDREQQQAVIDAKKTAALAATVTTPKSPSQRTEVEEAIGEAAANAKAKT